MTPPPRLRYWVGGATAGALLGALIPDSVTGLDFALTALFTVLALDEPRTCSPQSPPPPPSPGLCAPYRSPPMARLAAADGAPSATSARVCRPGSW